MNTKTQTPSTRTPNARALALAAMPEWQAVKTATIELGKKLGRPLTPDEIRRVRENVAIARAAAAAEAIERHAASLPIATIKKIVAGLEKRGQSVPAAYVARIEAHNAERAAAAAFAGMSREAKRIARQARVHARQGKKLAKKASRETSPSAAA